MSANFLTDLLNTCQFSRSIENKTISSDTTTNGTGVDMQPTDGPFFLLYTTGNAGDGSTVILIKAQESDDDSTYTDITGATVTLSASATANDNLAAMLKVDKRTKRYVRGVVVTSGGGTPSVPIAVSVLGRKKYSGTAGGYHQF